MKQIKDISEIKEGDLITFMGWGIPMEIRVSKLLMERPGFLRDLNCGYFWR